jgi:hypothetical protein
MVDKVRWPNDDHLYASEELFAAWQSVRDAFGPDAGSEVWNTLTHCIRVMLCQHEGAALVVIEELLGGSDVESAVEVAIEKFGRS